MQNYVFDLDGTIVKQGKPIQPMIAQKISQLSAENTIIFASARPVRDMLPLIPATLHHCLMLGCNGGMAWQAGEFLFTHVFSANDARRIVDFLKQERVPYVLDGIWQYAFSSHPHPFHDYIRTLSDNEADESSILREGVTKILVLDSNARSGLDHVLAAQALNFNLHHHRDDNIFDITPQVENKYLSLRSLDIDFDNTIAFGNDANDFAVLDHAKISVFVGEATHYPAATYYSETDLIPSLLDEISLPAK